MSATDYMIPKYEVLKEWNDDLHNQLKHLSAEITKLKRANEILTKAVEFYADRTKYQDHMLNISIPGNRTKTSSIEDDQGRVARLSISKIKGVV